jgi:hypothetical protein
MRVLPFSLLFGSFILCFCCTNQPQKVAPNEVPLSYKSGIPKGSPLFYQQTLADLGYEQFRQKKNSGFDSSRVVSGKIALRLNQHKPTGWGTRNSGLKIALSDYLHLTFYIKASLPKKPFAQEKEKFGFLCTVKSEGKIKYSSTYSFLDISAQQQEQFIGQWTRLSHWLNFPFEISPSDTIELTPFNRFQFDVWIDNLHLSHWSDKQLNPQMKSLYQLAIPDSITRNLNSLIYAGKAANIKLNSEAILCWESSLYKTMGSHDFEWKNLGLVLQVFRQDSSIYWGSKPINKSFSYDTTGQGRLKAFVPCPSMLQPDDSIRISLWDNGISSYGELNLKQATLDILAPL